MRQWLNKLGMAGLAVGTILWLVLVLTLGGSFIARFFQGLIVELPATPLANLRCPMILSDGKEGDVTAVIANPHGGEETYPVVMAQIPLSNSSGWIELCKEDVTIPPGNEASVSCPVSAGKLSQSDPGQTWYIYVYSLTYSGEDRYYPDPENMMSGHCIIRTAGSFWIELGYGAGITLTALIIMYWGAILWVRRRWLARTFIVLIWATVYSVAWLVNSLVWLGLNNLFFLILSAVLLTLILALLWVSRQQRG